MSISVTEQQPKVSIVVITYNQTDTLSQTIDSILIQKGDFLLELIICEDASPDKNTRKICLQYKEKFPSLITLVLHEKNQGILMNTISGLRKCTGSYVGICAGDDYWIDDEKIDKQLLFLKNNPEYGVVSTNGYKLFVKKNKLVSGIPPLNPRQNGDVFDLTWKGGVYAMPVSMLFKAELLKFCDFDEFIKRGFSVEDVPLQAIFAHNTKFGHIPDITCVYRVYQESATFISYNSPKYIYYHKGLVAIRKYLNELYPDDVEYSEEWAEEYMFYREFLMYLFQHKYSLAKILIDKTTHLDYPKVVKARKISKNIFTFYSFYLAKFIKTINT